MARPPRRNADYFPHKAKHGKRISHICRKFGIQGYGVYMRLLELLTDADDHHIDINDDLERELLISACMVEEDLFTKIYRELIKIRAFDGPLFGKGVIFNLQLLESLGDAYRKRTNDPITAGEIYKAYGVSGTLNGVSSGSYPQSKKDYKRKKQRREKSASLPIDEIEILAKVDLHVLGEDAREVFTADELARVPEFIQELKRRGVKEKDLDDFRSHFAAWVKKAPAGPALGSDGFPDKWDRKYYYSLTDPNDVIKYTQKLVLLGYVRSEGGQGGTNYYKPKPARSK